MDSWTAKAIRMLKEDLGLKPEDSLFRTINLARHTIKELRFAKRLGEVQRDENDRQGT